MQLLLLFIPAKLITIITGLYFVKKLSVGHRLLLLQAILSLLFESYGYYLGTVRGQNNVWVFCIYLLIDCWLLGVAGKYFLDNSLLKKAVPFLLSIVSIVWLVDILGYGFTILANRFFVAYSILLVIIYIAILFNRTFLENPILKNATFWIALSTILYYACIVPYVGLWNYLQRTNPTVANRLFDINLALNFIRYPLVALAFYLHGREVQEKLNTV